MFVYMYEGHSRIKKDLPTKEGAQFLLVGRNYWKDCQ